MSTSIEWTDETWNPATGCSRVSKGCDNCYAMGMARRFDGMGHGYDGTTRNKSGVDWTGVINTHPDRLETPLRWQKPRRVFVCSMGDLFHPSVPFDFIDRVFAVMALAQEHTFQVLTKRPARMAEYFNAMDKPGRSRQGAVQHRLDVWHARGEMRCGERPGRRFQLARHGWPLPNVWLGTSAEHQEAADERIPALLRCPAAVRFVSAEPLLGPLDLYGNASCRRCGGDGCDPELWDSRRHPMQMDPDPCRECCPLAGIDWLIAGGESGHGARPMHPDWVRSLRDQCAAAGTAFFFKQWGSWLPWDIRHHDGLSSDLVHSVTLERVRPDGTLQEGSESFDTREERDEYLRTSHMTARIGKKKAGRILDGQTHDEMPEAAEVPA